MFNTLDQGGMGRCEAQRVAAVTGQLFAELRQMGHGIYAGIDKQST
ncbi:hypothetical protein [Candidatus Vondammii sp. HM_W22]|nr:hypothetical protein [Candidatus Vondammii sp. HM_W22]